MPSNLHTQPLPPQRLLLKAEAGSKTNRRQLPLQQTTNFQAVGSGLECSNKLKGESLHNGTISVDPQPACKQIAERIRRRKQTAKKNHNNNNGDAGVLESALKPSKQDRREYRRLKRRIKRIQEIRLRVLRADPHDSQNIERLNMALTKLLRKYSRYQRRWNKRKTAAATAAATTGSNGQHCHHANDTPAAAAADDDDENTLPSLEDREEEATTAPSFQSSDLKLTASMWDELSSSSDDEAWDSHILARDNLNLALAIELPTMPSSIQTIPAASPRSLLQLEKSEVEALEQALRLQQKQQNGLRRRSSWRASTGTRASTPIIKRVGMKRHNSTGSIRLTSAGLVLIDGKPACVGGGSLFGPDVAKASSPLSSEPETAVATNNDNSGDVPDISQVRASIRAKSDAMQQGGEDEDAEVDEAEILRNAGCFCFFKH